MKLTLLHPYYDHKKMFYVQLDAWNSWSSKVKENVNVLVIDDHSEIHPLVPSEYGAVKFNLDVYRVKNRILWNTAGVKNLGFKVAETDWVIAADMDLVLLDKDARRLVDMDYPDKTVVYWPMRERITGKVGSRVQRPHVNSFVMNKELFWKAGGFDEDFSGKWGYEDSHFHEVAMRQVDHTDVVLEDIFFCNKFAYLGRVSTVAGRRGHKENRALLMQKRSGLLPHHSGNPIRFEWERVYRSRINEA